MMRALLFVGTVILFAGPDRLAGPGGPAYDDPRPGVDWPTFRGISGAGVAEGHPMPMTWHVPEGKGLRWKTPVEGLGHSSPIIWGDRLCVTTATSGRSDAGIKIGLYGNIDSVADDTPHTWKLVCLDKRTGKVAFERTMHAGVPIIKRHMKSTHANSTLATDGTHLVAMLGSEGLFAYDMQGKLLWRKDLGVLDSGLWRTAREDVPTWSTPTIHRVGGRTQVVVNGWRHAGAYDFKTGKEIWKLTGGGDIPVPTPIVGDGLVFITNAHGREPAPVYAIRESATGDISLAAGTTSNAGVAWTARGDGAYMITPLLYGGLLYVAKNNGVIAAFDVKTGERVYQQRLGTGTTGFTASLVAGDGKIYAAAEDGDVYVIKAGRTFEMLATNPLGDIAMATPAISEGVLYFRTGKYLMGIDK